MFVEERCYQLLPGRTADYLALYEKRGMAAQLRHLPLMLGYYTSEIGQLNEIVHLWGHRSLDERDERRSAMRADPDFKAYWDMVRPLIVAQRTRVMKAAPFFAARLARMVDVTDGETRSLLHAIQSASPRDR